MLQEIRTIGFAEAVRVLGDDYPHGKPFVARAPHPAQEHIITVPGAQYRIVHSDFIALCNQGCITAEGEHFVPTAHCITFAYELSNY